MTFQDEMIELLKKSAKEILGADPATLSGETRFVEDLNCKSADLVQISARLEDVYEAEVPYADMKRCKTFLDVAKFVDAALS